MATLLSAATQAQADQASSVEWQPEWRRVSLLEGLSLIPLGAAVFAAAFALEAPTQPRWRGGMLFDSGVRDALRGGTRAVQTSAQTVGDILYIGGSIAPILIDVGVVALGVHHNPDLALQLFLIDLQSLSLAGLVSITAQNSLGRARPYVSDCDASGVARDAAGRALANRCGGARSTKSFFSGHAAVTATVAGLTCIRHQHLPLYGGGAADVAPCVLMIGVSLGTGLARLVSDVHWASDVLLGWGVGALAGYLLPAAIHYGLSSTSERGALHALPIARMTEDGGEFGVVGTF